MGKVRPNRASRAAGRYNPMGFKVVVTFSVTSIHKLSFSERNEMIQIAPPFQQGRRLYIIQNTYGRSIPTYYIGTAQSLKNRYTTRIRSLRELGIEKGYLNSLKVYIVQVNTGNVGTPPNRQGITARGIDIEHLLIRAYQEHFNVRLQNIQKTMKVFNNDYGSPLVLDFNTGFPGIRGGKIELPLRSTL